MPDQRNAQQTAEWVRERMFSGDRATQALGMTVTAIARGAATVTMPVRADMLNGFDICHGGLITTLADTAFAYACNAGNEFTVAAGLTIDFVAPAREHDLLTATASEVTRAGRSGVYDATVTNQRGELVAVFRGRSHGVKGRPAVAD
jgi:acyl-CoA thioesterase